MPVFTDLQPDCSEEAFREALVQVAQIFGYLHFHPRPCRVQRGGKDTYETSYDGDKGFPDETFVHTRSGVTIVAELKAKGGKLSPDQERWIEALRNGPTPTFVWRPSDWAECLHVLEAGARGEPSEHVPEGSKPLTRPKATDDPDYRHAERTVQAWWEWHQSRNEGKPPTAIPFVAVVKIVMKLYKTGWSQSEVKLALVDATTISVGAMEFARNKRRQREGQAVNQMSIDEWRARNAGRPLTDRDPRPDPHEPDDNIIDTTATEA